MQRLSPRSRSQQFALYKICGEIFYPSLYIKSRIWEKKEGKYTKPLAKIQVTAIFLKQDMRRNVLPKLIEI